MELDKTSKKYEILKAAALLFRNKGYSATTMRDLAKEVGVEAASLYNHIKSKQEILSILLLNIADEFTNGITEVEQEDISPLEKIKKLIALHISITVEYTNSISLVTQEWRHLEGDTYQEFNNKRKDYEIRFKNILESGILSGEIKDVNPDIAMFSILSTMRWLYAWYSKKDDFTIEELEQQFCGVLIDGLKR